MVGGGPTGVELVGQVAELAKKVLPREYRWVDTAKEIRVILVEAGPAVLGPFHPKLQRYARKHLVKLGVEVRTDTTATDMDADSITVKSAAGLEKINARTKIWAAGVQASPLASMLAEATGAETDRAGRVVVLPDCTLPGHPEVFAIGDMVSLNKLPGVAQPAIQEGRYVGKVIRARLDGDANVPPFKYFDKGSMATIGYRGGRGRRVRHPVHRFHGVPDVGFHPRALPDRLGQPAQYPARVAAVAGVHQELPAADYHLRAGAGRGQVEVVRYRDARNAGAGCGGWRSGPGGSGACSDGDHARVPHHPGVFRDRVPDDRLGAEYRGLRRSDDVAMLLARRWSQVLGVLVAVGAVTGTVLSFEMGLLWPGLMRTYGAVLGVPFGFEGIFFFLEAIFTGIYLYGWQRLPGWTHFWTGIPIAITGLGGAVAVMAANSWMNAPGGFTLSHGRVVAVDPWQVFFNRASLVRDPAHDPRGLHGGRLHGRVGVRGRDPARAPGPLPPARVRDPVHDRRDPDAHSDPSSATRPPGPSPAQQPVKFAAIEYVTRTGRDVPEYLGGFYVNGKVYFGLRIPYADSLLVGFSPPPRSPGWTRWRPPTGRPR